MTQFRITPLNRPVDNHDWMDTPITPERQAASEAWQKQHAALYAQFETEWVPPSGYSAERDNEEMENIESAAFSVWEERRKGRAPSLQRSRSGSRRWSTGWSTAPAWRTPACSPRSRPRFR